MSNGNRLDTIEGRVIPPDTGCVLWTGATTPDGYGRGLQGDTLVHRIGHERLVEPIPHGLVIDHLCHSRDPHRPGGHSCLHRRCVNVAHLRAVTIAENLAESHCAARRRQRSRCVHGHDYAGTDLSWRHRGGYLTRTCRTCERARRSSARPSAPTPLTTTAASTPTLLVVQAAAAGTATVPAPTAGLRKAW